jgi:hypothetical protein
MHQELEVLLNEYGFQSDKTVVACPFIPLCGWLAYPSLARWVWRHHHLNPALHPGFVLQEGLTKLGL